MVKIGGLAGALALMISWVFLPAARGEEPSPVARLESSAKIWDGAGHNAFTDLLRHDGKWLCVFREGTAHIPGTDGRIRVLASADGSSWKSQALVAEKGIDLRDPKISLMPDGRLMILMGGSIYDGEEPKPGRKRTGGHSRVSFSKDGIEWSAPAAVEGVGDRQWLWRVTWHKGVGYGTVYSLDKLKGKREFAIWKTADGVRYEKLVDPAAPADGGEATIRFLPDDTALMLFRSEEKDRAAWIASSKPPYDKWDWKKAEHAAQGPDFVVLGDGRMFYAGRDFPDAKAAKTIFGSMTSQSLTPLITLASGGDTSYPGLVEAADGVIYVSYYSSHEGKTTIYLAKIQVTPKR